MIGLTILVITCLALWEYNQHLRRKHDMRAWEAECREGYGRRRILEAKMIEEDVQRRYEIPNPFSHLIKKEEES